MLQRIQTVYLLIVIVLLGFLTAGVDLLSFHSDTTRYVFDGFGIGHLSMKDGAFLRHESKLFFIWPALLIVLSFMTLMSYKDLNRQLKWGRLTLLVYLLTFFGVFY